MDMTTAYVHHIDFLKRDANITTNHFVDGVCSDRHYRRCLSGESIMSQKFFNQLLQKLNISPSEFYHSFNDVERYEMDQLAKLFNTTMDNQFEQADKMINEFKKHPFKSKEASDFFRLSEIYTEYNLGRSNQYDAVEQYKDLINYPAILDKKFFTFLEFASMQQMALISSNYGNYEIAEEVYKLVKMDGFKYLSSTNRYLLPPIYNSLSIMFGMKGDIAKSVDIAEVGIAYSKKTFDHKTLHILYYLASFGKFQLGRKSEAYDDAVKCISLIIARDVEGELEHFNDLFLKEQGFALEISKKIE